jgi:hypothetical protein
MCCADLDTLCFLFSNYWILILSAWFDCFRAYFETKPCAAVQHPDPCEVWRCIGKNGVYSCLLPFARLLFSVPATSAPAERCFSSASLFASKGRVKVTEDLLEMYVVTKSSINMWGKLPEDIRRDVLADMVARSRAVAHIQ